MKEKPSFETSMRALLRTKESSLGQHPSLADLIRYQDGSMSEKLQERTRDHLALCRACVRTLLELEQAAVERSRSDLSEQRLAAERDSLAAVRRRLESQRDWEAAIDDTPAAESRPVSPRPVPRRSAESRSDSPPRRFLDFLFSHRTLGLSCACALLLLWGIALRVQVWELSRPSVVESLPELLSSEAAAVRGERGDVVSIGGGGGEAALILGLPGGDPNSTFVVEIAKVSEQRPRWSSAKLAANPPRDIAIRVPAGFLDRGDYQVRLYQLRGSVKTMVSESPLRVQ